MGLLETRHGSVEFEGNRVDRMASFRIARLGLGLVPEMRQVFPTLSVRENLVATARRRKNADTAPWTLERVYALFPRLSERASNLGNQLSGGEQQMLAIGRALMTNPHLLILDEATEGLAPLIREDIWRCLATLKEAGQSILVIDKYVQRLVRLADHHTILERGKVVWRGDSSQLAAQPDVWHRYIGV
jgi:branched-chain amino acid transport system ATP-binding protein